MGRLYETIMALCEEKGITGYRLCKDIGITPGSLTDLKMGRKQGLSAKNISKIAAYFGVSTDYLLNGTYRTAFTSYTNGICVYTASDMQAIEESLKLKEPGSYRIVFRGDSVVITVDSDGGATEEQIKSVIAIYNHDRAIKYKAPTESSERLITNKELKFALWGDSSEIDDDDLEDVLRYAAFVKERKKAKK